MKLGLDPQHPQPIKLGKTSVRRNRHGQFHALDALGALGLEQNAETLEHLQAEYHLTLRYTDFGEGKEAVITGDDFTKLLFVLDNPEARRLRQKSQDIYRRYLEGDILLASEVAERSPHPEDRRWLAARLDNMESRKRFMSTVAKHGGEGDIYRQVSSVSNQSVLKMNSTEFKKKRKVKNTRDGLTPMELIRLSYLETVTAKDLEEKGLKGNEAILKTHKRNAETEQQLWEKIRQQQEEKVRKAQ